MHEIRILSLFSGVGMLDRAVHQALEAAGHRARTVLYCEADPFAAKVLRARMADGLLDLAPIWPDVRTLPAHALRGRVDAVVGGFPCQDLSTAGLRRGLGEGTRSGLFFDLLRASTACDARLLFLENVRGIDSAPADVPEEPDAEERAVAAVVGALADSGHRVRWRFIRASDVGAPHERDRWFAIAVRMADAGQS